MALNIKNQAVETLVAEVAAFTGESKTEAVRRALEERRARLPDQRSELDRGKRLRRLLESEIWTLVPQCEVGRRLSKEEEESILGFGTEGV